MTSKLKRILLAAGLIAASAVGAVLGGLQNKSWWALAASGAAGVLIQGLAARVGGPDRRSELPAAPVPRQLPANLPDFVGRSRQLAELRGPVAGRRDSTADVRIVFGPGGVGKTSLVIHAVALESARFPDGQLYVDLQGYGPNALTPEEVLGGWLRDLGLDERLVPATLAERSREFRSRTAGRKVAVVLDNADTEQQVRPLLVTGEGCVTYLTSRSALGGLAASMRLQLDGLSVAESVELLSRILGETRVQAETAPAEKLAVASGGLPLALRVLAGRLVSEPRSMATLTARLERRRGEGRLLAEFTFGDLSVEASLALSREHLSGRSVQAFDALGLHPADEWSDWSAAALWDLPLPEAQEILEELANAQLVRVPGGPVADTRYRLHDLVREFAKAQAVDHLPAAGRDAALVRLGDAYLAMADLADNTIHPAGSRHRGRVIERRYLLDPEAAARAEEDPFRWFALERDAIAAVVAACHRLESWLLCWQLADAASVGFENLRLWDVGQRCAGLAFDAAGRLGSAPARAAALRNLGEIDRETGEHDRAVRRLEESVELFRGLGDSYGLIDAESNLALVHMRWGNPATAEGRLRAALAEARSVGDVRGEAWTQEILGECAIIRGRRDEGVAELDAAAKLFRANGERRGEAYALSNLALLLIDHIGWAPAPPVARAPLPAAAERDAARAAELLDRAHTAFTALGDERNLAMTVVARIRLAILRGADRDARAAAEQGRAQPGFEADWRLRGLLLHGRAVLAHRAGEPKEAITVCAEALALVEPFGDRLSTACLKLHLGLLQRGPQGAANLTEARELFRAIDRDDGVRACEHLLETCSGVDR